MSALAVGPDTLRGLVAVSKEADVEALGFVCWYSVPVEDVSISRLRRHWGLAGLDPQPLPRDPRAVDAFKRAVRDEEKVGNYTDPQTRTKVETDVRPVVENDNDVIYQVTRVERDLADERVMYSGAVKVWFNKASEQVNYSAMEGHSRKDVLGIMQSIQTRIDANAKSVTGAKVREMIRSYIVNVHDEGWVDDTSGKTYGQQVGLSGESMGGSRKGVYFILAKHRTSLESLAEFLHGLYKPKGRAFLYFLPMADGRSEREMIRRHFMMNSMEAVDEEIVAVRELLRPMDPYSDGSRKRAVRENVVKYHYAELERRRRKLAEYKTALRGETEDVDNRMEVLNNQLRKLLQV